MNSILRVLGAPLAAAVALAFLASSPAAAQAEATEQAAAPATEHLARVAAFEREGAPSDRIFGADDELTEDIRTTLVLVEGFVDRQ